MKKSSTTKNQSSRNIPAFVMVALMVAFSVVVATSTNAATDTTSPGIVSVSPSNNEKSLTRDEQITVVFDKDMDYSTINKNTFVMMQRTTPELGVYRLLVIDGTVTYNINDRTATFIPDLRFSPNQQYGNVFTMMITTGVKDMSGNAMAQDYSWSFTTGKDAFNTGNTTSQQ